MRRLASTTALGACVLALVALVAALGWLASPAGAFRDSVELLGDVSAARRPRAPSPGFARPAWIPADWRLHLAATVLNTMDAMNASSRNEPELEPEEATSALEAERLFFESVREADAAWARLAPVVAEGGEPNSSSCQIRVLTRGEHPAWTCVRVDERSFATQPPRADAPPPPTAARAAVCLAGQVHALAETAELLASRVLEAFPEAELFVYAHATSRRSDGAVESWQMMRDAEEMSASRRRAISEKAARAVSAELASPRLRQALARLNPTEVAYFNATEYEAEFAREAALGRSACFERDAPKGPRQRGEMPCCHFSHRGSVLWGVDRCFAMVKRREAQIVAAGGARYRWVVRARPDYEPPTELYDAIRGDVAHDLGRVARVWMRHGPMADGFQIASRPALDALGTTWTELRNGSCLALPQEPKARSRICRQLSGSASVTWTNECLIALHLRRMGVQLHIGDPYGAGSYVRPP